MLGFGLHRILGFRKHMHFAFCGSPGLYGVGSRVRFRV